MATCGIWVRGGGCELLRQHEGVHRNQGDLHRDLLRTEIESLRAENERLSDLAQGRLEYFQHSEESRGKHFLRADRALTLLARVASYLDYMEERGYSSVRVIRADVYEMLREEGREAIPYYGEITYTPSEKKPRTSPGLKTRR